MTQATLPVTLTNATKRYGTENVVDGFSFHANPGEIVALLGPNGAGKTTSISMMLGLKHLTSGSAEIFGHVPTSHEARVRCGIMLQESEVPSTLKTHEVVEMFSRFYPRALETSAALDLAMLGKKANNKVGDLSGGEKQRLFFALAVIGDPDLLFLDEPSVGMDVTTRNVFWDRIRHMHQRGKAIVLTTHYLEEADALAERIVVINKGKQVAEGTPSEIKSNFANRIIGFRSPHPDHRQMEAFAGVDRVSIDGDRVELVSRAVEETVRELLNSPTPVSDLQITGASLEQAFVALTA
jgi:ABC-2 type transport system ATP-binding protein